MSLREKLAITIQSGLQLKIPMSELLDAVLEDVREAVEEAKPKEYGEVNTFSEVIENIDGFRKGVSAYHDALMEQLNK